jgi:hypothetical protein
MSTEVSTIRGNELLQGVLAHAMADEQYRQELLENPAPALREAGLDIPDHVEIVFHQNAADRVHFVLPSRPIPEDSVEPGEVGAAALSEYNAAFVI